MKSISNYSSDTEFVRSKATLSPSFRKLEVHPYCVRAKHFPLQEFDSLVDLATRCDVEDLVLE